MPEFLVKVADEQGHLRQQVENGYSEAEVHDRFTQQGYLVYWVKPRTILNRGGGKFGRRGKLRQSIFLIFNQQFLTLIKAGLPILTALDLLIKRQRDKSLLQLLENVRERVKGGELLSDAFAAQQVFPKMYTTTLLAGEKSGSMEEVLGRYIAYQRMVQTFRKKLPDDAPPAGAQCQPHSHLPLAGGGARQQKVGDIGAGDREHQGDEGHQECVFDQILARFVRQKRLKLFH